MVSIECDNMCREALLAFAGHFFVSTFTMADAGVHVGFLTGKNKSLYTLRDERDSFDDIKYLMSHLDKSTRATKEGHDDFMDTIRWLITAIKDCLPRAVSNKALRMHEWVDLLKWWFDEVDKELKLEIE